MAEYVIESTIRVSVLQGATDEELCKILGLAPLQLEKYRVLIDQTRTTAAVVKRRREESNARRRG